MIILGGDPDLHNCPFAILEVKHGQRPKVLQVEIASVPEALHGREAVAAASFAVYEALQRLRHLPDLVCIESQQIYTKGPYKTPNPDDILLIAHITGIVVGFCGLQVKRENILLPQPKEWKANIPKGPQQARSYKILGWNSESHGKVTHSRAHKDGVEKVRDTSWSSPNGVLEGLTGVADPATLGVSPQGQWKHVGDAIGLALWGAKQRGFSFEAWK